jgi:hypothetical protein
MTAPGNLGHVTAHGGTTRWAMRADWERPAIHNPVTGDQTRRSA